MFSVHDDSRFGSQKACIHESFHSDCHETLQNRLHLHFNLIPVLSLCGIRVTNCVSKRGIYIRLDLCDVHFIIIDFFYSSTVNTERMISTNILESLTITLVSNSERPLGIRWLNQ